MSKVTNRIKRKKDSTTDEKEHIVQTVMSK
jgi:hypothetical protein